MLCHREGCGKRSGIAECLRQSGPALAQGGINLIKDLKLSNAAFGNMCGDIVFNFINHKDT
jgi:hypothetical protein